MLMTGAQIVIECLLEQGVDTIFGYPGGTILNVYDALYQYRDKLTHILTSHEQGASHAADGYARSTGKVGVCMATSGPGATNLVTGLATAYMDSVPVVAITCNQITNLIGKDSFQEVDIMGMTMPITKHNYMIKDIRDLAPAIRRAFKIATSGRPGPVLVDITKDVTAAKYEYEKMPKQEKEIAKDTFTLDEIDQAIEMIKGSKQPFVMSGGGVIISEAAEELKTFVDRLDAPVCDTLMGKGSYPNTCSRYTGMIGMHGTKPTNFGVSQSDLLIVIGARFSDRVTGNTETFASQAKIIHIDIDEAEIDKNIKVDHAIVGDAKEILKALNSRLEKQDHSSWMKTIQELKEKYPLTYDQTILTGPYIIETIDRVTNGEALIVTEVGQHQMWAAQYFKYKHPRQLITSGGLGTMGFGLGAAIGTKLGNREKTVFNIAGDGCFRMNLNEMATVCRNHIPLIQVVLNNQVLGMVRQWQTLFYDQRYSHTILNDGVDFVKLSEAFGAKAYRVTKKDELEDVIKEAIALNAPVLIECVIDQDDKVWPMVAPGGAIVETFTGEDLK
ncbi:biosynthetic-type acetolactate synthase large subunit [Beduini massiliensis]|uniref:biosynthetic-type acetolactate synthase large subunit n=1 Tax=Beduini massiliensis TaxID=1585974 RepID=UPI000B1DEB2A|nr:biosynthetic-type acetolactate synthase large subunit [Beduini massiliensis]